MLKKLKSFLQKLTGAPAETPAAKPAQKKTSPRPASKGKSAPQAAEKSAAPNKRKPRKKTAKSVASAAEKSAPAPRKTMPEKPAELREIPAIEGKTRFGDLPIHRDVLFGIQHMNFEYCTPIQAMTLMPALDGKDIAGKAQTGTGKTAAFLIALFTHLLNHPLEHTPRHGQPRALVLAPTRELAIQIHKDACNLGIFTGLTSEVVFGGMDHEKQRKALDQPIDLLVGTPGRVIDYSRGSTLDLSKVEVLIIDEADRMLDMGFIPDVKRIVAQLPGKGIRHTMLFSATLEESILRLASGWLVDPVILESEPEKMVSDNIEQTFYSVLREEKLALTHYFLTHLEYDRMLIFGNRKDVNLRLQSDLARYGIDVPILSGDIAQEKRIKILERFRNGDTKVVIATDVAARGIHVDDVSIVLNYDLPERAEDYVHRIGRTGRAGRKGTAISFLCEYGAYNLPAIEELLGVTFSSTLPEESMLALPEPTHAENRPAAPRSGNHRGNGRRPARRR